MERLSSLRFLNCTRTLRVTPGRPRISSFQRRTFPQLVLPRREQSTTASTPEDLLATKYEYIALSLPRDHVAQITLNRPRAGNALCTPLINDLNNCLTTLRSSPHVHAVVLTGSEKFFAAGADIKEMMDLTFASAYTTDFITTWADVAKFPKPIIAAVSGHCLGGGCELAMMCDIMYVTRDAKLGQPEIGLGVLPGAGGSQRLTRAVGKSRAMEIILTGAGFSGEEAERWGLASKVFDDHAQTVRGALDTAEVIASRSRVAVQACKDVVNKSQETGLREGLEYERRVFHAIFGTKDQKLGMKAFIEKQKGKREWTHE